jgi:hypothetical protein
MWHEVCSTYRGEKRSYRVLVAKPAGRRHLGDVDLDGRIILKLILKKKSVGRRELY